MENPCRYCEKWDPADREFGQVGCVEMCRAGVEYIALERYGVDRNRVFMIPTEDAKYFGMPEAKEVGPGETVGELCGVKFIRTGED